MSRVVFSKGGTDTFQDIRLGIGGEAEVDERFRSGFSISYLRRVSQWYFEDPFRSFYLHALAFWSFSRNEWQLTS
jgi:hypothetical protein